MSQSTPNVSTAMGELDPLIGRTISGRYRVHALIGQGGMGKVFEAQQIPLGRSVALKVLSTTQKTESDAEFQQRFLHEASILAKLKSPNTVTIFDYGRDGNIFFIAMELVAGKPLDRVLRETPIIAPPHALGIALQIARSLREAHTLGVVHRDLKPANVLIAQTIDGEEHVKVLDFGLAKRLTVSLEDTNRNVVPGSPKYMAPEVIRQEAVDGRADIYALGILLYQMLIGRVPFDAENPLDILLQHVRNAPMPISQAAPNLRIPPALEQLVMRCLEKQPSQRFATMQELIDGLRAVAQTIGLHGDMHSGLSMFPSGQPTSAGGVLSPSGRPGGPHSGAPRKSDAPRLRLDVLDATPSHTKMRASALARKSVLPLAIATACGLAGAFGVWLLVEPASPEAPGATALPAPPEPAAPAPVAPSTPAPPRAEAEEPDMEFTTDQVAEHDKPAPPARPPASSPSMPASSAAAATAPSAPLPSITVTARSIPTGAAVMVRGTRMGLTPVTFKLQDASATAGNVLVLTFQLAGYESETVRHTINGSTALIDTVLQKKADQVEEPAESDETEAEPEPEPTDEDALRQLGERAKELEKVEPVLKITETPGQQP